VKVDNVAGDGQTLFAPFVFVFRGVILVKTELMFLSLILSGCGEAALLPENATSAPVADQPEGKVDEKPAVTAKTGEQPEESKEIVNSLGMRFVRIPKGTFLMGSPNDDDRAGKDEVQHEVTLTKDFFMSTLEVTQEQYERVMGGLPSELNSLGAKKPVNHVSWTEATNFARRLSDFPEESKDQRKYRLPTEAEWEYACRAGTQTGYSFGDSDLRIDEFAWYDGNSRSHLHEGGQKKPNSYGLYDMHGNVWEWCSDWYGDYPSTPLTDPRGPDAGSFRVLRGGSWNFGPYSVRCARRGFNTPGDRYFNYGFRLVLE